MRWEPRSLNPLSEQVPVLGDRVGTAVGVYTMKAVATPAREKLSCKKKWPELAAKHTEVLPVSRCSGRSTRRAGSVLLLSRPRAQEPCSSLCACLASASRGGLSGPRERPRPHTSLYSVGFLSLITTLELVEAEGRRTLWWLVIDQMKAQGHTSSPCDSCVRATPTARVSSVGRLFLPRVACTVGPQEL